MAKKTKKSGFVGRMGDSGSKSVSKHKGDVTSYGSGSGLPAGIKDGVAKLTKCYFDKHKPGKENAGEYYFFAMGVIVSPTEFDGSKLAGRTTSILERVYDTPGRSRESEDEHIKWIMNELRKLGVDTDELEDAQDLEDVAAALQEAGPHFKFRTWKGEATEQYPNPRVNEVWEGECNYEASEEDDVEDDSEESEESEEEVEEEEVEKPVKKSKPTKKKKAKEQTLEELGTLADDNDDTDAQEKLLELAKEAGVDQDDVDGTGSWSDVVALIENAGEAEGEEEEDEDEEEGEEEEAEEEVPEKGDVYKFKPKGKRKALDIEVTAVFEGKKTCNVKTLADGVGYKGVAWSKLEIAD